MKMDTINALHNSFKDASAELQDSQDRVSRLEEVLQQYQQYSKNLKEEEIDVDKSTTHFKNLRQKEQQVLSAHEETYQQKQLELDLLNYKIDMLPVVLCGKVDEAIVKQNDAIVNLEKTSSAPSLKAAGNSAAIITSQIIQAKETLKMAIASRIREHENMFDDLQVTLEEETDTLRLLQACIDGMLRKKRQSREGAISASKSVNVPPATTKEDECKEGNFKSTFRPRATDHCTDKDNRANPGYVPKSVYSISHPKSANQSDGIDSSLKSISGATHQSNYQTPWYMFNKKRQRAIGSTTTTTTSNVVMNTVHEIQGAIVTTTTKKKKSFRSGSEILNMIEQIPKYNACDEAFQHCPDYDGFPDEFYEDLSGMS